MKLIFWMIAQKIQFNFNLKIKLGFGPFFYKHVIEIEWLTIELTFS